MMIYKYIIKKIALLSLFFIIISVSFITTIHLLYGDFLAKNSLIITFFNSLDESLLQILNVNLNSINNVLSYFLLFINVIILINSFYVILLAIKTSKYNEEFLLLINPLIKRPSSYLKNKIIISFITIILYNLILYLIYLLVLNIAGSLNAYTLFLVFLAFIIYELTLFSLVTMISTFIKSKTNTYLLSFLLLLFFFILRIIIIETNFSLLSYLNPLNYFNYLDIINNNELPLRYISAFIIITVFSLSFAISESERN